MMVDPVTVTVWGCRVYYDGRPCNCYSLGSGGVGCTMMVDPVTVTVWGCRVYYDGRPCNCKSGV